MNEIEFAEAELQFQMIAAGTSAKLELLNELWLEEKISQDFCGERKKGILEAFLESEKLHNETVLLLYYGDRRCRNCEYFTPAEELVLIEEPSDYTDVDFKGICDEGGHSEIANPDEIMTPEKCNAWKEKK